MAGIPCQCLSCQIKSHKEDKNCPHMECRRGEPKDKTQRHVAVKLSISPSYSSSFFYSHNSFHSSMQLSCAVALLTCSSDYTLVFFNTHNSHTMQNCSSCPHQYPLPCKHRLGPHWYVYQPASVEQPEGSQQDQSLKSVSLSEHTVYILQTVHILYVQSSVKVLPLLSLN